MDCLVYVDPSQRGEWALALAAQLPARRIASLVLLATAEDVAHHPDLLSRARARLAAGVARIEQRQAAGPAERAIVSEVLERSYDLVIVPPAGRNALQRMLKGSRVATVVRSIRASVLVARRPPARVQRVLVAVSGGAFTPAVIAAGLEMESAFGARAAFLHVASEVALPFEPAAGGSDVAPSERTLSAIRELLGPRSGELLVREGLVVDELFAEVENGAHDLLVVGAPTEPEGGWGREDVTERLLLGCPTSVLIVRRPAP